MGLTLINLLCLCQAHTLLQVSTYPFCPYTGCPQDGTHSGRPADPRPVPGHLGRHPPAVSRCPGKIDLPRGRRRGVKPLHSSPEMALFFCQRYSKVSILLRPCLFLFCLLIVKCAFEWPIPKLKGHLVGSVIYFIIISGDFIFGFWGYIFQRKFKLGRH